jgi:glycosyltransferase involved in cell wall biosynthesis
MEWVVRIYAGLVGLFWLSIAAKTWESRKDMAWKLDPNSPVLPGLPRLRVVIPARNEAANIGACLQALSASDHPNWAVTVFDDGSTDGTGAIAEKYGAEVLRGEEGIPPEWRGKTWALQRATRNIQEEWILFLDADVRVQPTCLSRTHSYAITEKVDLLSGYGRLTMESFWEKVIQPTVGGVIVLGNPMDRVNDDQEQERVMANGQLILVRREVYEELGAHERVKDKITEDVELARLFRGNGRRQRCLMMRDLFSCRMYSSLEEIWLGWTKNFYIGLRKKRAAAAILVFFLLVYNMLPALLLPYGIWSGGEIAAWLVGLWGLMQGVRLMLDLRTGQEPFYGLLQPLGAFMVAAIVLDSMRRAATGKLVWKGRVYAA